VSGRYPNQLDDRPDRIRPCCRRY